MTVQAKATPKWKLFLRRLFPKPTPFWRKRLEDRLDEQRADEPFLAWVWPGLEEVVSNTIGIVIMVAAAGFVLAAIAQFMIAPVFLSPGFMQDGLADPIGRGLANICLSTGQCDVPYLLAGSAFAVVIFATLFLIAHRAMRYETVEEDEATVSEEELLTALSSLDERVVRLRADLVLAGVIPLSKDEIAETVEYFAFTTPPTERAAVYQRLADVAKNPYVHDEEKTED